MKRFSRECRGWTTPVPISDQMKTTAALGIGSTVTTVTTLFLLVREIRKKEERGTLQSGATQTPKVCESASLVVTVDPVSALRPCNFRITKME
jgi:hypothetical protein